MRMQHPGGCNTPIPSAPGSILGAKVLQSVMYPRGYPRGYRHPSSAATGPTWVGRAAIIPLRQVEEYRADYGGTYSLDTILSKAGITLEDY
jgi:hypothetical protein